jgi:hypothetical protein
MKARTFLSQHDRHRLSVIVTSLNFFKMLNYFVQALQQQAEEYLMVSDKPQLIPCMPCLAPRPGDPSLLLGGFSKIMHVAADCILAQRESVDEDASNFAIVNMETSEVRQKGSNRLNLYLQSDLS